MKTMNNEQTTRIFVIALIAAIIIVISISIYKGCKNDKYTEYNTCISDTDSCSYVAMPSKSMTNEEYCKSISSNGETTAIFKAEVTDSNILIIGVDRAGDANFDIFCESQLEDAWSHGVRVDACFAVDIKDCEFQDGAVVGERIGKAFK